MNDPAFPEFIAANSDWTLRVRKKRERVFEDVQSVEAFLEILKGMEGETIRVKLFCGNDEWGPIEEGRAGYAVHQGRLCQSPELRYEIRSCVGLAQYCNEQPTLY